MLPATAADPHAQDRCASQALRSGTVYGFGALAGSSSLVLACIKYSEGFRRSVGVSGKTALVVSPGATAEEHPLLDAHLPTGGEVNADSPFAAFFAFFLFSELEMFKCVRLERRLRTALKA